MSKEKFKFNVMMFGGKRTGKTSVLAALQECFDKKFSNVGLTISPDDKATTERLKAKRQEMDHYFTKTDELFECSDSPTPGKVTYSFKIQIQGKKNGIITLNFIDYPGEWVNKATNPKHYKELAEEVKKAHIIIVAIDTPYLVEHPTTNNIGKYNGQRNFPNGLAELLKSNFLLGADYPPKMVLFVPLKCERYYHSKQMTMVTRLIISSYGNAISYLGGNNAKYCETVILPILTLGGIDFYDFKRLDNGQIFLNAKGLPITELYKKRDPRAKKATPCYCEQPASYILMYLLDQAKESMRVKKGSKVPKLVQKFLLYFQNTFMGMPTAAEFINIREEVLKVINDEEYIHGFIYDPLKYNTFGGES